MTASLNARSLHHFVSSIPSLLDVVGCLKSGFFLVVCHRYLFYEDSKTSSKPTASYVRGLQRGTSLTFNKRKGLAKCLCRLGRGIVHFSSSLENWAITIASRKWDSDEVSLAKSTFRLTYNATSHEFSRFQCFFFVQISLSHKLKQKNWNEFKFYTFQMGNVQEILLCLIINLCPLSVNINLFHSWHVYDKQSSCNVQLVKIECHIWGNFLSVSPSQITEDHFRVPHPKKKKITKIFTNNLNYFGMCIINSFNHAQFQY